MDKIKGTLVMNNKLKAKEIAAENKMTYLEMENDGSVYYVDSFDECEQSALEMAQWKDEQFKEEKKELLGLVKMIKVDEHNQTIIEDLVAMLE